MAAGWTKDNSCGRQWTFPADVADAADLRRFFAAIICANQPDQPHLRGNELQIAMGRFPFNSSHLKWLKKSYLHSLIAQPQEQL
jgi:hypothetical protein